MTIAAFFALGFYWALPKSRVSNLNLVLSPKTSPDLDFMVSSLERNPSAIVSTKNVAWVRERATDGSITVHYWCPSESNTWGELVIEWSWDAAWSPELVILDANLHLFPLFDKQGQAELYVASQDTRDQWIQVASFNAHSIGATLNYPVDITRWVRNSKELRIKYRIKAERLMYHPTPDDPIGIAGAQCLRQGVNESYASRLRLWRNKPTE